MTEYTMAEQNFRDEVKRLAKRKYEYNGPERTYDFVLKISPRLDQALAESIPAYSWGGAAKTVLAETAEAIIEAVMTGEVSNAFEFREAVEHDGPAEFASAPKDETARELAGQLYWHSWEPEREGPTTLSEIVDTWPEENAHAVAFALYRLTEEIWDECEGAEEIDDTI